MSTIFAFIAMAGATIFASGVATLSGFGLGTIMTPLVLLFFPYAQAIYLVSILHWFHDIWKIVLFKTAINWRLCLYFGVPSVVGSFLGAWVLTHEFDTNGWNPIFTRGLGGVLILYSVFILLQLRFTFNENKIVVAFIGLLSGLSAGLFGIRGAMKGAFLSGFDLDKESYIKTMGFISLILDSTRLIVYAFGGIVLSTHIWYGLLLLIPATYIGSRLARSVVHLVSHEIFYKIIAVFLGCMGLYYLLW